MIRLTLFAIVVLAACLVANGQRVQISSEEFAKAAKIAGEALKFPARTTTVEEVYDAGNIVKTITSIWEGTPSLASRLLVVESGPGFDRRTEVIECADFVYTRHDSGSWSKRAWYFRHAPSELIDESVGSFTYTKESLVRGSAKIVVLRSSRVMQPHGGTKGYRDEELFFEGMTLLKRITTDRDLSTSGIRRRVTFSSEHDPKISIEAPIK